MATHNHTDILLHQRSRVIEVAFDDVVRYKLS